MSDLDLRSLLRPGARGDAIPLFGVLIASPAAPLRSVAWTDAESDRAEGEERAYRGGRHFRVLPTGEMEELLLEDSIEQTIAATGVLRLDGSQVCARIERGTLARVFVRGARLDVLALRSEADIVARFGVAEGLERDLGYVTYHYPSRALSITWSATDHKIVNVCLGGTPWEEPTLGARDLLDDLFAGWPQLAKDRWQPPPSSRDIRYYMYQRIAALTRALGIGSVEDLVSGEFIARRQHEDYRPMMQALLTYYGDEPLARADDRFSPHDVRLIYDYFLSYRRDAQVLLRCGEGVLMASGAFAAALRAMGEANSALLPQLARLDEWLARVIDPEQRALPRSELIAQHQYPDVDLFQLRAEQEWD